MGARRILVANQFASYRQTIALVIRDLHPDVEVFEVASEAMDGEITRLGPDLVICSRVTSMVRQRVANWVEMYPDYRSYSTICISGIRRAKADVQLSDLLSLCASLP